MKTEKETREYFADKELPFGQAQLDCLCQWSYHTNELNRLFYEDYEKIMAESPFKTYKIKLVDVSPPLPEIYEQLCLKYPGYKRFDVGGIEISAEK